LPFDKDNDMGRPLESEKIIFMQRGDFDQSALRPGRHPKEVIHDSYQ
jgi:hypothetical protein